MKDSWIKIKKWLADNHSEVIPTLNAGASAEDLKQLELVIGTSMPDDFKLFYSVHNGQTHTHLSLFDGDCLLSIADIISEWKQWKQVLPIINQNCIEQFDSAAESIPDSGIRNDWWNILWIPITSNGFGDNYCIDLDPADEGTKGQIIRMCHDDPARELVSPSFREWISGYITDLENNLYEASNNTGFGGVVRKEY